MIAELFSFFNKMFIYVNMSFKMSLNKMCYFNMNAKMEK